MDKEKAKNTICNKGKNKWYSGNWYNLVNKRFTIKNIPSDTFGNMLPKVYISFLTIDGKINNMLILYMNSKTIKTLIDDIKKLMIEYNNHNKIEKTDVLVKKYTSQIRFKRK